MTTPAAQGVAVVPLERDEAAACLDLIALGFDRHPDPALYGAQLLIEQVARGLRAPLSPHGLISTDVLRLASEIAAREAEGGHDDF